MFKPKKQVATARTSSPSAMKRVIPGCCCSSASVHSSRLRCRPSKAIHAAPARQLPAAPALVYLMLLCCSSVAPAAAVMRVSPYQLMQSGPLPAVLQAHLQQANLASPPNISTAAVGRLDADIVPDIGIGFPSFDCVTAPDCGGVLLLFVGRGTAGQPDARLQKHVWLSPDSSYDMQMFRAAGSLLGTSITLLGKHALTWS